MSNLEYKIITNKPVYILYQSSYISVADNIILYARYYDDKKLLQKNIDSELKEFIGYIDDNKTEVKNQLEKIIYHIDNIDSKILELLFNSDVYKRYGIYKSTIYKEDENLTSL